MPTTHAFVSAKSDGSDTTLVRPSNWNAAHVGNPFGYFNVVDYGATGNGSTDDTTAVQNAINAAGAYDTVFFPVGTYKITSTLTIPESVRLLGPNAYPNWYYPQTILRMETANTTLISATTAYAAITIENLFLFSPGGNTSGRGIYSSQNVNLHQVGIFNFWDGVYIDDSLGTPPSTAFYNHIHQSWFSGNTHSGITLHSKTNNTQITETYIAFSAYGILADGGAWSIRLTGCSIEQCTTYGVYIDGSGGGQSTSMVWINGCFFELLASGGSASAGIYIGPATQVYAVNINGNHFTASDISGYWHIDLNYADQISIIGNNFGKNSEAGAIRGSANTTNVVLFNNNYASGTIFSLPATTTHLVPDLGFRQTNSVTVASTASETALSGTGTGSLTIPAYYLTVGRTVRVRASGYYGTTGSPTLQLKVKFGSTILLDTGANTAGTGISTRNWTLDGVITIRTVGSSGTAIGQGIVTFSTAHSTGTIDDFTPNTSTTTVNTTTTQAVSVTAQWGTSDASNTITCTNLSVEVL